MKILYVIPYTPLPPQFGGALRIHNLLRQMSAGHDVSVVYFGREGTEAALREGYGGRIRKVVRVPRPWSRKFRRLNQFWTLLIGRSHFSLLGFSPEMRSVLMREFESGGYDIVQTEFSHMAQYAFPTDALKILDAHNVEYDLHRRQWEAAPSALRKFHYGEEYRKIRREEIAAWRRQDLIFTTSERDRDIIRTEAPRVRTIVLPNGVDSGYFSPSGGTEEPDTLVFTGVMKYLPNSDGIRWFLDNVLPLIRAKVPGIRLFIVGANPAPDLLRCGGNGVSITGKVDDVRPYVNRAAVSIVPLRMGGGTRLKIVESFAMKKAVVSTAIGAEGIDARHGESIMIADEPAAFADAVVRLLKDPGLRAKLARNAHDLMMEKYEWSVIGRRMDEAYTGALERRVKGAGAGSYSSAAQRGSY